MSGITPILSTLSLTVATSFPPISPPLSPSPNKHSNLRSCLSPNRSSSTPPRSPPSRAESYFSDTCSSIASGEWRRTKSVRWEGEDEGSAVTSYFSTYSSSEYDRTPLEPPSEAERTCVLPARGSRCLRTSPAAISTNDITSYPSSESLCDSPTVFSDALAILTSQDKEVESEETTEEDQREWEECMDRRRMMFAMRQEGGSGGVGCPEFEGFRSISKSLVEMLRSVGGGCPSPPIQEEDEEEGEGMFERLRGGEEEEEGDGRDTPSLISSAGSEVECTLGNPEAIVLGAQEETKRGKLFERVGRIELDEE